MFYLFVKKVKLTKINRFVCGFILFERYSAQKNEMYLDQKSIE